MLVKEIEREMEKIQQELEDAINAIMEDQTKYTLYILPERNLAGGITSYSVRVSHEIVV